MRTAMRLAAATALLLATTACTAGSDDSSNGDAESSTTRTYYIAADPVRWDYAPEGRNKIHDRAFTEDEQVFAARGRDRIGSRYEKCLYRGYTDDTFATLEERPESEAHLGYLGPVIRAEVGDTIKVVFKNKCSFPTSVHPHGVRYAKDSEGAPYADGTSGEEKGDDEVPTNGSHTYTWEVPERSGPAPMEGSSAGWMYHSHADEVGDVYAGLTGFLIITAKGEANPDGSPKDIDREVFSLFEVDDENQSPLLEQNLAGLKGRVNTEDEGFEESNLMHAINGYVYGNGPMVVLHKGEAVRWYLMGMGTEVDLHTPHWHDNTAVVNGMRTDVTNLLPASMITADMQPDAEGTWLFHCHVGDHIAAGMQARYHVEP